MPIPTPEPSGDIHDPTSAAYKKARKRFFKTTKNRAESVETGWTPFRAAEKKYKAVFPPPDLAGVLDLALLNGSRLAEVEAGRWCGREDAVEWREVGLREDMEAGGSSGGRKAYAFPDMPGLLVLPSFVSPSEQRELVRWALSEHARHPNETNLDTHYVLPPEGLWNKFLSVHRHSSSDDPIPPRAQSPSSLTADTAYAEPSPPGPRKLISNAPASPSTYFSLLSTPKPPAAPAGTLAQASAAALVPRLRWANIGWFYHWGTKQYDFSRGPGEIDARVRRVCKGAVGSVRWEEVFGEGKEGGWGMEGEEGEWGEGGPDWKEWDRTYEPDAGIVNFYQTKDTLMAHVDRSEVCATSPLVSISLGCAAVFLIGGQTRDVAPMPILLRSGDVVIMAGPRCRRAYHGVPRILQGTLPPHLQTAPNSQGGDDRGGDQEVDDDWEPCEEFLRNARVNVNVRQVFPRGFVPPNLDGLEGS